MSYEGCEGCILYLEYEKEECSFLRTITKAQDAPVGSRIIAPGVICIKDCDPKEYLDFKSGKDERSV